jgi:Tfp pilus assembly protein PilF
MGRPSRRALVGALVAAITCLAFWPSLQNGFVAWDDDKNFLINTHYRGLGLEQLRWMWGTFHLGIWIPLSWMTLGLNYVLFGMEPAGYHATNMLLHAVNAGLLYLIGLRVLAMPHTSVRARLAAASPWALPLSAAFGALAFALHPLRVESVTWITERRDVLSGAFYLGTVLMFLRYAEGGARASRWYALSVVGALLALLSKGTAVTLPGALALLWCYPLQRVGGEAGWGRDAWWRAVRVLSPFAVLSIAFTVLVFVALQPVAQLPPLGKLAVSAYSWCFYVGKTLWPTGLAPLYAMPDVVDPWATRYLVSYGVVTLVAVACGVLRKRLPAAAMAVVAFTVIAFPLLGVHQGGPQIVADRNSHNASFAFALLAGGAMLLAWSRARVAAIVGGIVTLGALATATWKQTLVWHDSDVLWARVLEVEPDSPYGHNNYGNALMAQGRVVDALAHYQEAVRLRPRYENALALANLGVALAATGRTDDAISAYQRAIAADSTRDDAEGNWGVAVMGQGDLAGAIAHFTRALAINPENADAQVNWGNALVRLGRAGEAIAHYEQAVAVQPEHANAHLNWGVALVMEGNLPEAAVHFRRALEIQPSLQTAQDYLAQAERDMVERRR